jgi:hypothetical protein
MFVRKTKQVSEGMEDEVHHHWEMKLDSRRRGEFPLHPSSRHQKR